MERNVHHRSQKVLGPLRCVLSLLFCFSHSPAEKHPNIKWYLYSPVRPHPCIQRALASATILIACPVGFTPSLHGSGFPYTSPSTP
ncbi:hypothetical protein H4582DRAFT_1975934 [Lactarius indigo]|nr:hypothetical protein H4582DRAFT_1975934 [Lactarius indigo]